MYPRTFQKYKKSTRPYCQFQRSSEFYLEIFAHVRMQLLNCDFSYKKGSIQNIISCGFWKKSFRFLVHILSKTFYQLPNALPQPFFVALVLTQKLTSISVHVQISTSNRETAVYTGQVSHNKSHLSLNRSSAKWTVIHLRMTSHFQDRSFQTR